MGYGVYKFTDEGRTWQRLGPRDSQMIAAIAVDPGSPDRWFDDGPQQASIPTTHGGVGELPNQLRL